MSLNASDKTKSHLGEMKSLPCLRQPSGTALSHRNPLEAAVGSLKACDLKRVSYFVLK